VRVQVLMTVVAFSPCAAWILGHGAMMVFCTLTFQTKSDPPPPTSPSPFPPPRLMSARFKVPQLRSWSSAHRQTNKSSCSSRIHHFYLNRDPTSFLEDGPSQAKN
jgi:hypothetical protein